MTDVCFNVLHYRSFKATSMCVHSLLRLFDIQNSIILIFDNGSKNGSIEKLKREFNKYVNVHFYINKKNDGFTQGMNKAYAIAVKYKPLFIIALNNDIQIQQKSFIRILKQVYKKYPAYIIGPDVYNPREKTHQSPMYATFPDQNTIEQLIEGRERELQSLDDAVSLYVHSHQTQKIRKFIPGFMLRARNKLLGKGINELYHKKYIENAVLQGSCIIATPLYQQKEQVLFEPDTGFYAEELLLALKCHTLHYKTLYTSRLRIVHWHGIASGFADIPTKDTLKIKNERLIHAYKIYKECLLNNPWK